MNAVAAIQMVSTDDVESNLRTAEYLIARAAERGAKLIVLPENFAVFSAKKMRFWAEREAAEQVFSGFLSKMSKNNAVWIVGGTVPMLPPENLIEASVSPRVRTTSLVFDDDGELKGRYDKIHLFDVDVGDAQGAYFESEQIEPGSQPVVIPSPYGNIGLSVCYDLRFPELYVQLVAMGADIITVPAAFTWKTGKAHWDILLRARAIECQCYIVGANQGGVHSPVRRTWGHSSIVDPWGERLGQLNEGESILVRNIDRSYVQQLRQSMPVQQHKRFTVTANTSKALADVTRQYIGDVSDD
ncbi:hypothetical protein A9Q99_03950 [Gammaproteobacteria bacterium 45_16_T64]|nr:hypothetical protein A9Q99_03950 [Gammaproteobacteria bacterium 45_16_T64]